MWQTLRLLIADIRTPSSRDETLYQMLVIAVAHGVLAAAIFGVLGQWFGWTITFLHLFIPIVYWFLKEWPDIKRGGAWADSWIDTAFVAAGVLYPGPAWWPVMLLLLAGVVSVWYYMRRRA